MKLQNIVLVATLLASSGAFASGIWQVKKDIKVQAKTHLTTLMQFSVKDGNLKGKNGDDVYQINFCVMHHDSQDFDRTIKAGSEFESSSLQNDSRPATLDSLVEQAWIMMNIDYTGVKTKKELNSRLKSDTQASFTDMNARTSGTMFTLTSVKTKIVYKVFCQVPSIKSNDELLNQFRASADIGPTDEL